ncbi:Serine/threonine-protein kinase smg1 [Gaertneriomyces sp. JEL0708]|nr:Serine/threonine-protein kinase smg1 [Gaertneriomyces sp. JEL0708]
MDIPDARGYSRADRLIYSLLKGDGTLYGKRTDVGNDLLSFLNSPSTANLPANTYKELLRNHSREFEAAFQDVRAPTALKAVVATCLATIGAGFRSDVHEFLEWIFDRLLNKPTLSTDDAKERDKESKAWLLVCLRELLSILHARGVMQSGVHIDYWAQQILRDIQTFMDLTNSPDLLPKVLDLLTVLAEKHPAQFSVCFTDVIDLLIGWSIDPTLPKSVAALISDLIKKLWPFWSQYLDFGIELTRHLLSDIENATGVHCDPLTSRSPLANGDSTRKKSSRLSATATALQRCFQCVLYAITFSSFPLLNETCTNAMNPYSNTYSDFVHVVRWSLQILLLVGRKYEDRNWLRQGTGIVKFLSRALGDDFVEFQPSAADYLMLHCSVLLADHGHTPGANGALIKDIEEWLDALAEIFNLWRMKLNPAIFKCFTRSSHSMLLGDLRLHYWNEPHIIKKIEGIVKLAFAFFRRSSEDIAEPGTEELVAEMCQVFNLLVPSQRTDLPFCDDVGYNKWMDKLSAAGTPALRRIWACDLDLICEGAERGVPGFDATTVSLYLNRMLSNCPLTVDYVGLVDRLMLRIYGVAKRQSFFAASAAVSASELVALQLHNIHKVLDPKPMTHNQKITAMAWFRGLLTAIPNGTHIALDLVAACASKLAILVDLEVDPQLRVEFATLWRAYAKFKDGCGDVEKGALLGGPNVLEIALCRMDDVNATVATEYFDLACTLSPALTLSSLDQRGTETHLRCKLDIMAFQPSNPFRTRNFLFVTQLLGMESYLQQTEEYFSTELPIGGDFEWIVSLFHASHHSAQLRNISKDHNRWDRAENSADVMTFWLLWEGARYIVLSRLRTPLGSPLQTFEAIEGHLRSLVTPDGQGCPDDRSRFLKHLLVFIDLLEIQILNAIEGSLHCAAAPKPSIAFFLTNRKSCDEWFLRIRSSLITGSRQTGLHHHAIRHAMRFLEDPRHHSRPGTSLRPQENEKVLLALCEDLIRFREPDTLRGVAAAVEPAATRLSENGLTVLRRDSTFTAGELASYLPWIRTTHLFAAESYERALQQLLQPGDQPEPLKQWLKEPTIARPISEAYVCIGEYDGLRSWRELLAQELWNPSSLHEDNTYQYRNYAEPIHVLASWEPAGNINEAIAKLEFSSLDDEPRGSDMHSLEKTLVSMLLKLGTSASFDNMTPPLQWRTVMEDAIRTSSACTDDLLLRPLMDAQLLFHLTSGEHQHETIATYLRPLASRSISAKVSQRSLSNLRFMYAITRVATTIDPTVQTSLSSLNLAITRSARRNQNYEAAYNAISGFPDLTNHPDLPAAYEFAKLEYTRTGAASAVRSLLHIINAAESDSLLRSKSCMRIAEWSRIACSDSSIRDEIMCNIGVCGNDETNVDDAIANYYLFRATEETPEHPKTWFKYAEFCHKQAKRLVDDVCGSRADCVRQPMTKRILAVFMESPGVDLDQAWKLIQQYFTSEFQEGRVSDKELRDLSAHLDLLKPGLGAATSKQLGIVRNSVIEGYKRAFEAYFQQLRAADQAAQLPEADILIATLRILRILVKYGPFFEQTFHTHFLTTPIQPWEGIIPQLFARLDHPHPLVKQSITTLICRIAAISPHLVVYQAVAESAPERLDASEVDGTVYERIYETMRAHGFAALVGQVQTLVNELKRTTVLWEELWFQRLTHLQTDADRKMHRIQTEAERVQSNMSLSVETKSKIIAENYSTIVKPLAAVLEKLMQRTSCSPTSTAHEQWFQKTYGGRIKEALTRLRAPDDYSKPRAAWESFEKIQTDLTIEVQRSRDLKLETISPLLASTTDWVIPMPGLPLSDGLVTVSSFCSDLQVLPTKTKPKKLELIGSDGRRYTYLFKGMEDLHLDERIQQFLGIINRLLLRDKAAKSRALRARTYAVIPFGERFGMIQWVDNVTPLFSLYKRWQQRDHTAKMIHSKPGDGVQAVPPPPRPHEQYHAKITAALKSYGMTTKTPRRDWPAAALRNAFESLQKESPSNIVQQEIWGSSPTPKNWWAKVQTFARSTAVMSIIGYVIGLGDRHLDNILFDRASGELVHIDYNVCFENGRKLRVPETVPFRMTRSIRTALGFAGLDGAFRAGSEHTLRVLRSNKDILMTLLETFVYDPLVDWTKDSTGDLDRKMSELNVNLGLISSRISEEGQRLQAAFAAFSKVCVATIARIKVESSTTDDDDVSANPELRDTLIKRRDECNLWHVRHISAVSALQGSFLSSCASEILSADPAAVFPSFGSLLHEIVDNDSVMIRCVEVDQDLYRLAEDRRAFWSLCLDHLQLYHAAVAPVTSVLLEQDYFLKWRKALDHLIVQTESVTDLASYMQEYMPPVNSLDRVRKSGMEARMKAVCAAKEEELGEIKSTIPMDVLDHDPSVDDPFAKDLDSPEIAASVFRYAMLDSITHFAYSLYLFIKQVPNHQRLEPNPFDIRSLTDESVTIYGRFAHVPQQVHEISAIISSAIAVTQILGSRAQALGMSDWDPKVEVILEEHLSAATAIRGMGPYLAEHLLLEISCVMMTHKDGSVSRLMGALRDAFDNVDATLDPTAEVYQEQAQRLQLDFAAIREEYALLPDSAAYSVICALDKFLGPMVSALTRSTGNSMASEQDIILNVLGVHKIHCTLELLRSCQACCDLADSSIDPTHEWISHFDFSESLRDGVHFQDANNALSRFLDLSLREMCIKPLAKTLLKIIKRLSASFHSAPTDTAAIASDVGTGVACIDYARTLLNTVATVGNALPATLQTRLRTLRQQAQHNALVSLRREGQTRIRELEGRLQQQKLALLRYQLLHENALVQHSSSSDPPQPTARLQFIQSLQSDLPKLMKLNADLKAAYALSETLRLELEPYVSSASSNPAKSAAISEFLELARTRQARFQMELTRGNEMIDLCETLLHFEVTRVEGALRQSLDAEITALIEATLRRTSSKRVGDKENDVDLNGALQATVSQLEVHHSALRAIMGDLTPLIANAVKMSENLEPAKTARTELTEYVDQWSQLNEQLNYATKLASSIERPLRIDTAPDVVNLCEELVSRADKLASMTQYIGQLREIDLRSSDSNNTSHDGTTGNLGKHGTQDPAESDIVKPNESDYTLKDEHMATEALGLTEEEAYENQNGVPSNSPRRSTSSPARHHRSASGSSSRDGGNETRASDEGAGENEILDQKLLPLDMDRFDDASDKEHKSDKRRNGGERNAYAVHILKRVKMKLEGRDGELGQKGAVSKAERADKRLSVEEQIDQVVKEATDVNNLAAMYQGWMGWI